MEYQRKRCFLLNTKQQYVFSRQAEMFPLKYKTAVCFLSANTKQYVSYRITKLCFHLANTKQYVFYRKTKDAKDMLPITSQNYVSSWKSYRITLL